jgi:hypothetical protein
MTVKVTGNFLTEALKIQKIPIQKNIVYTLIRGRSGSRSIPAVFEILDRRTGVGVHELSRCGNRFLPVDIAGMSLRDPMESLLPTIGVIGCSWKSDGGISSILKRSAGSVTTICGSNEASSCGIASVRGGNPRTMQS